MFENFKKITIKGGCFENETELELFKKDPVTVVYGRNGSGKTTIARAMKSYCQATTGGGGEDISKEFTVTTETEIPEENRAMVFIFDEEFVSKQVRVGKEGINTIVMLGEQVELDEQISIKKGELDDKEKELGDLQSLHLRYEDAGDIISPDYFFNQIRDGLRRDGGWADIDRDLKANTLKSRVSVEVVQALLKLDEPQATNEELMAQLKADVKLYLESSDAQVIEWTASAVDWPENLNTVTTILATPLESPKLTDREQRLLNMVARSSHLPWHFSQQNTRQLVDEGWDFCPLCLRDMDESDRSNVVETLTHMLNKEAEEFEMKLNEQLELFARKDVLLPVFPGDLNSQALAMAKDALEPLNKMLVTVRERIEKRKSNVYEAISDPFTEEEGKNYEVALIKWKNAQETLCGCVDAFNESVLKRKRLFEKARNENNLLARKQFASLLSSFQQAEVNRQDNKNAVDAKTAERDRVDNEIKALQMKKERTDIALDYINEELQYVFYSARKVKLEPGDGYYKLTINGRNVLPDKISVGERNVLGLCYFFAKLFSGKTEATRYASESLIIIDDPVSSFDYGNRVGVMSLLRYQFGNILRGNSNSRILVMSHDLHSVFDLVKIRNEVARDKRGDKSFMELTNNKLEVLYVQNEYKKLLERVYEYAANSEAGDPDETQEISIGNVMRRMLEAFSSFCYNETFERMLRKEDVLSSIPKEKKPYYENFMCRLTLNDESHMEESVYSLNTITSLFTKEEKVQTAKSMLLFLLYINKPHLASYLDETKLAVIEGWKTEESGWLMSATA
jgi:hypothetical protein